MSYNNNTDHYRTQQQFSQDQEEFTTTSNTLKESRSATTQDANWDRD
jgi:hypothetical protein